MPQIRPISAIRYAADGGDLSTLIAPPYDVLDEGPKQALLQHDPHNIVAVDLPVTPPKTVGPDEAYEQAGSTLRQWLGEGVLQRDATPAFYAYEQAYTVGDQSFRRRGLFANVATEPFGRRGGGIHQHEHTIAGGVNDRTKLMTATAVQLSPVFSMFHDPNGIIGGILSSVCDHREPDFHGTTENDKVDHRCWRIDDPQTVARVAEFFAPTDVFIADGHHRYNTALGYAGAHADVPEAQHCLMVLVACEDPGMIVLATHRVITGLSHFTVDALVRRAGTVGLDVKPVDTALSDLPDELPSHGPHAMGLYDPASRTCCVVSAASPDPLAAVLPDKPEVWRTLDVAVLHELLIDRVLRPEFGGDAIAYKYTAHLEEVPELAATPDRLGVIMQPTPLQAVCDVSLAGEVMPPKSTYFFPKLATGLIINPLS